MEFARRPARAALQFKPQFTGNDSFEACHVGGAVKQTDSARLTLLKHNLSAERAASFRSPRSVNCDSMAGSIAMLPLRPSSFPSKYLTT